jgi:methionine synthase II (cobalamin-independent)
LKEIEDREIERVIKRQEDVGLEAITDGEFRRSWWHLDFLWGLDGAEKHIMDAGVKFAAVNTRNEGVQVTGKLGMAKPHPMVEHFKFVAAHTKRTPKITIPAPSAIYGRPMMTPINKQSYPSMDRFFDDLGQAYKKAVRGFRRRGLPLSATRRSFHRHAVRSEVSRADDQTGRRSGKARPALRRSDQRGDVGHSGRHDDHDASVPRQLQIDLHGCRRLRRRGGSAVQPHQRARLFHGV